jgi:DNA-directed RNA polymerase III subunit RPC11
MVEKTLEKSSQLFCQTCPYICLIKNKIHSSAVLKEKLVDDVIEEGDYKNAQISEGFFFIFKNFKEKCPKSDCDSRTSAFICFQTRSADEPMTEFYKCTKCGFQWRQN